MGPIVLNVNFVFITQMEANNFLSDFIHLVEIIDTF